jgi:hypothetical protein
MTELEFKIIIHNKLCDIADTILMYYNPCQIKDGKCLLDNFPCCTRTNNKRLDGDIRCQFLGENGCTIRNLRCKTWLCETAIRKTNQECIEALKIIEQMMKLYGLGSGPYLGEHYVGKNEEIKHG